MDLVPQHPLADSPPLPSKRPPSSLRSLRGPLTELLNVLTTHLTASQTGKYLLFVLGLALTPPAATLRTSPASPAEPLHLLLRKTSGEERFQYPPEQTSKLHQTLFLSTGALQMLVGKYVPRYCSHGLVVNMGRGGEGSDQIHVQREENLHTNVWNPKLTLSAKIGMTSTATLSLRGKLHKVTLTSILEE